MKSAIAFSLAVLCFSGFALAGGECKPAGCGEICATGGCEMAPTAHYKWVDIEKKGWDVKCEDVAIPPVKLPRFGDCLKAICTGKAVGILPESGSPSCGAQECAGGCGVPGCVAQNACGDDCSDSVFKAIFGHHAKGGSRTVGRLKSKKTKAQKMVVEWKLGSSDFEGCGKSCSSGCAFGGCGVAN